MRISDWSSDVCSSDLQTISANYQFRIVIKKTASLYREISALAANASPIQKVQRSEEHTSELQSLMRISYAVFCLKKKKTYTKTTEISRHTKHKQNTYYTRIQTA